MEQGISADPANWKGAPHVSYSLSAPFGEFSVDAGGNMSPGRSSVRHACEKFWSRRADRWPVDIRLDEGRDTYIDYYTDPSMSPLTEWMQLIADRGRSLKSFVDEADFVMWRGTMTRIGASPYDKGDRNVGLKVACCKFKEVGFICEYNTEAKIRAENTQDEYQKRVDSRRYYGGYCRKKITSSTPNGRPDLSKRVSAQEAFVATFVATIGPSPSSDLRVFFGAEIDCINSKGKYMEIKTQFKEIGAGKYFQGKALKWWLQSFLAGVQDLIVGLRDGEGRVKKIELLQVVNLPVMCPTWSKGHCLHFLHAFLTRIKQLLDKYPEGTIVVAERAPNSYEFIFTIIPREDAAGQAEYSFIPSAFKAHFS